MSRLRRLSGLCSRILSDPANRLRKIRKKKSSAVPHISQRSPVSGLRQAIQGKGVILKRVETAGVYPLVRPRGVSADSARFASAPLPMSTSSRLTNTRKKGILISPAGMAELADAPDLGSGVLDVQVQVLLPAPAKNAVESLHSVFLLPIFTWTACSVPSAQSAPWLRWRAGACPHRSDLPHRMRQP